MFLTVKIVQTESKKSSSLEFFAEVPAIFNVVERLGGFWWCKGMLFILRKDFGESMCEVSAKRVCMITLLSLSHFMQKVWKQR